MRSYSDKNALAQLSKNKILDAEPTLQYRVQVGEISGDLVNVYQILQSEWYGFQYKRSTGELIAMRSHVQDGLAIFDKTLSLISRR